MARTPRTLVVFWSLTLVACGGAEDLDALGLDDPERDTEVFKSAPPAKTSDADQALPFYGGPAGGGSPTYNGPAGGGTPNPNIGPGPSQASVRSFCCATQCYSAFVWNYVADAINNGQMTCCQAFESERSMMAGAFSPPAYPTAAYPTASCAGLYTPGLPDMFPTTPPNPVGCAANLAVPSNFQLADLVIDVPSTTNLYIAAFNDSCPGVP